MEVKHNAQVLVGDYQFADKVKEQVESLLKVSTSIPHTNVRAFHTVWDWEPDNITFRNLKSYIREEVEKVFQPGRMAGGTRQVLQCTNFWANVYKKGDYAQPHDHKPWVISFAYFVKAKWYDSPLIFVDSGKRIRPKEGRFVAFPSYLMHSVPKHRYNDTRITVSGNYRLNPIDEE